MSRKTFLGIDLGGTNCRGALVDSGGMLTDAHRMATRIGEGLEPFLDRLVTFCRELVDAGSQQGLPVTGVGIGVPGLISDRGMVRVSPNLPPLDNVPLAARLEGRVDLPVTLVNDADAIAWGEAVYGAGRDFASFLAVTLGTGVGGGLVLERRLWQGADGVAGEVGHVMVEPQGRPCSCGSRGCLERYASATGIIDSVQLALEAGEKSPLFALGDEELTCERISAAARKGDPVAQGALNEAGRRLGQVLSGVANLLNPNGIVITGGASESLDLMRPALDEELRRRAFDATIGNWRIVRGQLGDDAGILGAAGLVLQGEGPRGKRENADRDPS